MIFYMRNIHWIWLAVRFSIRLVWLILLSRLLFLQFLEFCFFLLLRFGLYTWNKWTFDKSSRNPKRWAHFGPESSSSYKIYYLLHLSFGWNKKACTQLTTNSRRNKTKQNENRRVLTFECTKMKWFQVTIIYPFHVLQLYINERNTGDAPHCVYAPTGRFSLAVKLPKSRPADGERCRIKYARRWS